ncbi:MAG: hypothetical protein GY851_07245 [bacterium]|nr:hypothetical protein [bacterium]
MRKTTWICLALTAATAMGAWGAPPRYIEALRVGGGAGDSDDGGADLESNGDIRTDGDAQVGGELTCDGGQLSLGGTVSDRTLLSIHEGTGGSSLGITHRGANSANAFIRIAPEVPDSLGSQIIELLRTDQASSYHDVRIYADYATMTHYFDGKAGNAWHLGDLQAKGGDLEVGMDGAVRGVLTLWDGASSSAGCLRMHALNGTGRYVFATQQGHLRITDALPASDDAGWPVAARTLTLSALEGRPCATSGCAAPASRAVAASGVNIHYLAFDADTDEYAFWTAVLPSDYRSEDLAFSVTWTSQAGAADDSVDWNVEARVLGNGGNLASTGAWGTAVSAVDTLQGTNYVHSVQAGTEFTPAGTPQAGDYIVVRVYRDADDATNDTLNGDAQLLALNVRY